MKKNLIFLILGIFILAAGIAFYKFYLEERISVTKITEITTTTTQNIPAVSDSDLIDLMISLEDDLGMKEVLATQFEDILEVRFSAPTISGDELNQALVQIFGYIDGKLPDTIKTIRLVFVINYIDSGMVEIERIKISDWKTGKLDNEGLIKAFEKASFVLESSTSSAFPYAYAQSEACPSPNSHQEGDLCICDRFYKAVGGQCVPMSASEICPTPNSHQEGENCVCDSYYKAEGGQCVRMSELEMCGKEHAHRVGDQCVCDEGYGAIGGQCVDASAYCASHNAHFDASINDCKCNEGYTENADKTDCIPVKTTPEQPTPSETTTTTTTTIIPETETTTTTTTTTTANTSEEEQAPSLLTDPTQILLNLQDDAETKIAIDPITSNLTADEKSIAEKQIALINDFAGQDEGEIQFDSTAEQKLNMVKSAVAGAVYKDTIKWESEVKTAETEGKFKNEEDKAHFESLMSSIKTQEELYKQNVEALNTMHKQNLMYILDENAASKVMQIEVSVPKRDFLKEAQGDPTMASVYATQAAAAQYKLLGEIKDEIRKLKEQKIQYLDVRPKPNVEDELKKIKLDLYKK